MKTPSIIAAALCFPIPANPRVSVPADSAAFRQRLQNFGSDAIPNVSRKLTSTVNSRVSPLMSPSQSNKGGTNISDQADHEESREATATANEAPIEVGQKVSSATKRPLAALAVASTPGPRSSVSQLPPNSAKKEQSDSATGSLPPKQDTKHSTKRTPDVAKPSGAHAICAIPLAIPTVAAPTVPAPDVLSSITPQANFAPTPSSTTPVASTVEPTPEAPQRSTLTPPALAIEFVVAAPDTALREATPPPVAAEAPAPPIASAKPKAQPQPTSAPNSRAASVANSPYEPTSSPEVHQPLPPHPALARENAVSHSVLHTAADAAPNPPFIRARPQTSPQPGHSSGTQESATASAVGPRNLSAAIASIAGAHPSSGPATAAPSASTAQTTTQLTPQLTTQLATQPSVQSAPFLTTPSTLVAPAAPAPPPAHTQLSSDAPPEPAHPIDSAQLRVTPNSSELKISVQLPELGKVEVRAVTNHDGTTAHLTAFRHEALPVLAADRNGLEEVLKSRDVVLGSFASQGHSGAEQRQHSAPAFTPAVAKTTSTSGAPAASVMAEASAAPLPDYASISVHA